MQPPATVTLPPEGRIFRHRDRVTLADVSPAGRARLDALARWLQDAAYDDSRDSGLDDSGVWIVRRLGLRVRRFPRLLDEIEVATFCSGAAALWAERSSLVSCDGEVAVEAVALWVHLQPDGARPQPLPAGFDAVYGPSADGPPRARAAAPSRRAAGRSGRAAVALPRRRPRPRRPRQQRGLLGGARGRARRARAGRRAGRRRSSTARRPAPARRPCWPTARCAGSPHRTARSWRR